MSVQEYFRGLRKLHHVTVAIMANEIGKWAHTGWTKECGEAVGTALQKFKDENSEYYELIMTGRKSDAASAEQQTPAT